MYIFLEGTVTIDTNHKRPKSKRLHWLIILNLIFNSLLSNLMIFIDLSLSLLYI